MSDTVELKSDTPITEDATTPEENVFFFMAIPFLKRDRGSYVWLKDRMTKALCRVAVRDQPETGLFRNQKFRGVPRCYASELNVLLIGTSELSTELFSDRTNRLKLERIVQNIHAKYLSKIARRLRRSYRNDVELKDTFEILSGIQPDLRSSTFRKLDSMITSVYDDTMTILRNAVTYVWDFPGTQTDQLIVAGVPVAKESREGKPSEAKDLADELAFLALAHVVIPILRAKLERLAALDQVDALVAELRNLAEAGMPSMEAQRQLEDLTAILVGKVLSARDEIWLARKVVNRMLEIEEELREEAEGLGDPDIEKLYTQFVNNDDVNAIKVLAEQAKEKIDAKASELRDLGHQVEKAEIISHTQWDSQQMVVEVLELYAALEELRLFVQSWQDIPYFTTVLAGFAQETGVTAAKTRKSEYAIDAKDVYKTYHAKETTVYAVRGVDVRVKQGEYVAIVGPSGSGKTTLLNVISGLDKPDRGDIYVAEKNIAALTDSDTVEFRRNDIAFVFQDFALLPEFNAQENTQIPAQLASTSAASKTALGLLERVEIDRFKTHLPGELSGGQQQRVAIARSLVNTPKVIFADEPTGSLDHGTGVVIMDLIERCHNEGSTVLTVTHDLEMAARAERILVMLDGKIRGEINPRNEDVEEVFRSYLES